MGQETIGLAVIARDEEDDLPQLLTSVEGAFDQVLLLDTGSEDKTVDVFKAWTEHQADLQLGCRLGHFKWRDDFSAARNHANSLLETDWLAWADCDDTLLGAGNLRSLTAELDPTISGVAFPYHCSSLSRERTRLFRRGRAAWTGRVHELLEIEGGIAYSEATTWVHRNSEPADASKAQYLRIARDWVEKEPSARTLTIAALLEAEGDGEINRLIEYLRVYRGIPFVRMRLGRDRLTGAESAATKIKNVDSISEALPLLPAALGIDEEVAYGPVGR